MEHEKLIRVAPCVNACPAGLDIPRYVNAVSEGRFNKALAIIREKLPFPSVCGRICFKPCEEMCNANHLVDRGPIAINALKRFLAERPEAIAEDSPPTISTGKSVAVVGSGPAGLTAAYYLRKLGHSVTVFEMLSEPGGMVRFGIPEYRMPKYLLAREIRVIEGIGVDIKTNSKIETPGKLLGEGYDAVFVAIGAHKSIKMAIEGEDLPGVIDCIPFMRDLNLGKKPRVGEEVVVVGGGNAAIDAARCALRLRSKKVTILYRRSQEELPANLHEVNDALAEGVKMEFLTFPEKIVESNGKLRIQCMRTRLCELDDSCRRRPVPELDSEFTIEANTVISAIGQIPDIAAESGLTIKEGNLVNVDLETYAADQSGIFAGGDAVSGPASFIESVAAGRRAAVSINKYLGSATEIDVSIEQTDTEGIKTELQGFPVGDRIPMPKLPIAERLKDFSQVELGFSEEQAVNEAKRCLKCNLPMTIDTQNCTGCLTCVMRCSVRFEGNFNPSASKVSVIPYADEKENEIFFSDECDSCGICARFCPHDAIYRGEKNTEAR